MRVAIVFDMEGTSHIGDLREPFPFCSEYWRTGRQRLTNDVASAALGLLDGGATEVVVINHHGAGETEWPNLVNEGLPEGVRLVDWEMRGLRDKADGMFQVGCHARGGSQSFLSHTMLPGLRLRLGGELLSESRWWAWTGDVPVLGIVGSAALGSERGSLSDVPFLAVQTSQDRRSARPIFANPEETASAIRAFAGSAIRDGGKQRSLAPHNVVLEASLQNSDDSAPTLEAAGWTRTSRTEFQIVAGEWRGVVEAVHAAIDAAWIPYTFWLDGLDPSSEESSLALSPDRLAVARELLESWASDRTVE